MKKQYTIEEKYIGQKLIKNELKISLHHLVIMSFIHP